MIKINPPKVLFSPLNIDKLVENFHYINKCFPFCILFVTLIGYCFLFPFVLKYATIADFVTERMRPLQYSKT